MTETPNFALPLLATHQAQKHVTVNEALVRIDALSRPRVQSCDLTMPPVAPAEGDAWIVAPGGADAWAGHDGEMAFFVNGGWAFHAFEFGASVWDATAREHRVFDGVNWVAHGSAVGEGGATTRSYVLSFQHDLGAGATSVTAEVIPSHAIVLGVTARVVQPITGSGLTGFSLGVAGAVDRYGSGLGVALNAWAKGVTGQAVTYYADTPLVLTAEGGDFAQGAVQIALHLTELIPPRSV